MIEVFESLNGEHWKETLRYRPATSMTRGDIFWFYLGHLLLLPLALCVLVLYLFLLPFFWLWTRWQVKQPLVLDVHGEVQRILADPRVNDVFEKTLQSDGIPDVSVVIPFYNRVEWVDRILGSIMRQILPEGMTAEIIAVDNGSIDGTLERLAEYPVRIVECLERGPGAARNAGIAAARAPVVAFTDSDCLADDFWLANITNPFFDPEMLIAGGQIISMQDDGLVSTFTNRENILNNSRFFTASAYFPRFFATANAAYRRDALLKVGGFDNKLWMSEDADLAWRVMDLGGRMTYRHDAAIYHQHRHTLKELFRQAIDYGAASVAIFQKHRPRLGATFAISWKNIRDIAWSPFNLLWDQIVAKDAFDRKRELLYILWRIGFTYGSVRECVRRRVFFL